MNELEKELIETYGNKIIPIEEIKSIIEKTIKNGLIERKQYKIDNPMDATNLFEYISLLRRQFLFNTEFTADMNEEIYEGFGSSYDNTEKAMDKVLKAFFEYENIRCVKEKKKMPYWPLIVVVLGVASFYFYIPEPY